MAENFRAFRGRDAEPETFLRSRARDQSETVEEPGMAIVEIPGR